MDNSGKPLLVTPKDLKAALEKERVVLVDTRAPDAFAKEHIPHANNIHECFTFLATSDEKGKYHTFVQLRCNQPPLTGALVRSFIKS